MLNNAWPSMIWHMYDWYLRPAGSYFGVKKACEPLHVQYSYDDHSIVVVNSYYQPFDNLRVTAKVYNVDMAEKFSKDAQLSVGPDSSTRVFTLPPIQGLSSTYFVYDISTWAPTKTFADYTALNQLPKVDLDATARSSRDGQESSTTVTVHNPTSTLAFAVHLKVNKSSSGRVSREGETDNEILPVLWQDNYFALLPGETRQVTATYRTSDAPTATPSVEVEGWNVNRKPADVRQ